MKISIDNGIILVQRDIEPVKTIKRFANINPHDQEINRAREMGLGLSGYIGNMNQINNDVIIREVAEVGFSPYSIFRDYIKDTYNHVVSMYFENLGYNRFTEVFGKHFKPDEFQHRTYTTYSTNDKDNYEKYFFSEVQKIYISVSISDEDMNIMILATNQSEALVNFIAELESLREKKKKSQLNIICFQNRFYLESFNMAMPCHDKFGFFDCYNDDFEHVAGEIERKLAIKDGKGIVLVHGGMGNGKTTFLRRLITNDLGKKVIYMPPDMAHRISSPEFVTFLMDNPNSILIIEDAENILKSREAGDNAAVSNLLNVSDGILGDALHLQIVCTFNAEMDTLDTALLRPGRLIAEYRFDKLKREKATALIKKIYGDDAPRADGDMSLAEIFNMEEELIKSKTNKVKLGFT
jgi:hypothetical protein